MVTMIYPEKFWRKKDVQKEFKITDADVDKALKGNKIIGYRHGVPLIIQSNPQVIVK